MQVKAISCDKKQINSRGLGLTIVPFDAARWLCVAKPIIVQVAPQSLPHFPPGGDTGPLRGKTNAFDTTPELH